MNRRHTAYGLSLSDLSVLVVDDSAQIRQVLNKILFSFGCRETREACDGTGAFAEIIKKTPGLIILDWEMHPMNGGDFLRQLRARDNEPLCFVPVIVLTAHARPQLIQTAFECGASQFLVKPITPRALLDRMQWVLQDGRLFEPAGPIYRQAMPRVQPRTPKRPAGPAPIYID